MSAIRPSQHLCVQLLSDKDLRAATLERIDHYKAWGYDPIVHEQLEECRAELTRRMIRKQSQPRANDGAAMHALAIAHRAWAKAKAPWLLRKEVIS